MFYALLATMNMYFVLFNPAGISANFDYPFSTSGNEVMAFVDGWAAFAFEILGIALFALAFIGFHIARKRKRTNQR